MTKVYQGAPVYQAVVVVDAPQDVVVLVVALLAGHREVALVLQTGLSVLSDRCGSRFAEYVYGLYFSYFFSLFFLLLHLP